MYVNSSSKLLKKFYKNKTKILIIFLIICKKLINKDHKLIIIDFVVFINKDIFIF